MIATFDLGNSSLGVALHPASQRDSSVAPELRRIAHGEAPDRELLEELARAELRVGVHVHGRVPAFCPWLAELGAILWVGRDLPAPGEVAYDDPREMGCDRRVVAWGALCSYGPSLVVDCGTAITLTHIDAVGRIHGIGIGSGLGTLARGLAEAAPALAPWLLPLGSVAPGLARGSQQNLAFGVHFGWRGLVAGLVTEAEARLAAAGLGGTLVWAGTDAAVARAALERGMLAPGLVHEGLLALGLARGSGHAT